MHMTSPRLLSRLVAHGDYRAETHFSLFDALVGCGDFGQRIRFCNHFNFAGGGDLERFVEKSAIATPIGINLLVSWGASN